VFRVIAAEDETAAMKLIQRFLVEGIITRPDPSLPVEYWDIREVREGAPAEWTVEE
jgi:hypothetical protein